MADEKVDVEALLQHRPFVQRLARGLVRDAATADDIVQETWVTALENPPRHPGALRAWLAAVVRKLAWTRTRGERRRAGREHKVARPLAAAPPLDVLERARWHRRVVDAVMRLPEPYRTTILLRYFEDLKSREIGRLQKVPAATVRTRLKRGLERLRAILEETAPGWLPALAALILPSAEARAAARTHWTAAGLGGAVLAVSVGMAVLVVDRERPPQRAPSRPLAAAPAPPPDERDDPPVSAAEGLALEVTVLADGRPAEAAPVVLARKKPHPWRHTRYDLWRAEREGRTDANGVVRFNGLDEGYVRILATAPGFGRAAEAAFLPQELPHAIVLELPRERPVLLEVRDAAGGAPLAGARVQVFEPHAGPWLPDPSPAPTDAEGRTVVRGLPEDGALRVRVTAPQHASFGPRAVRAGESLVVELEPRTRTLAWPLAGGGPPPGTVLVLRRIHEAASGLRAVVEPGAIVAEGLPPGSIPELLAIAPDGSFARLTAEAGATVGPPVAFEAPALLEVRVADTRGAPVANAQVCVHDAQTLTALEPQAVTGPGGRAHLPVYAREPVAVRVAVEGGRFQTVGRFDPAVDRDPLEVTLPAARRVVLHLSEEPGLFALYAGRERLDPVRSGQMLRFTVRPGMQPVPVSLLARGFVPVHLEVPAGVGDLERAVELEPAGRLVVHVLLREREQPFQLQLVDARTGAPPRRGPWRFRLYPGPDRVVREAMLPPGRYRVRDAVSGRATEDFRVLPGGGSVRLYLDLQDARRPAPLVRGRVRAFAGLDLGRAAVTIVAPDGGLFDAAEVARDGSFAFPWPGEGRVAVHVTHPSVPGSVSATLDRPRDDLSLELTPTYRVWARLQPDPGDVPARVLLFSSTGRVSRTEAQLAGGVLRFAGARPGGYDVWLDVNGFEPVRLGDIELGPADTALGAVELRRGSTLHLRILAAEGGVPPALTVAAQALDEPRYQRFVRTAGEARAALGGLGAGRFHLVAWDAASGRRVWSQSLAVDGRRDRALEIDLR